MIYLQLTTCQCSQLHACYMWMWRQINILSHIFCPYNVYILFLLTLYLQFSIIVHLVLVVKSSIKIWPSTFWSTRKNWEDLTGVKSCKKYLECLTADWELLLNLLKECTKMASIVEVIFKAVTNVYQRTTHQKRATLTRHENMSFLDKGLMVYQWHVNTLFHNFDMILIHDSKTAHIIWVLVIAIWSDSFTDTSYFTITKSTALQRVAQPCSITKEVRSHD